MVPASLPSAAKPLRIAFFNNLLAAHKRSHGGVRQWTLTMANALVDRGYAVDMLVEDNARHLIDEPLLDPRVRRIALGHRLFAGLALYRYAKAHPNVRIVAALDHYNLRAAKLKYLLGDRVHVTLTQRENLSADAQWRKPLKYWWQTRGVRTHFNKADAVVAVSRGLMDDLREKFGVEAERLHTIYNPAYREKQVAATGPAGHPWLDNKAVPVIIAAGRLHFVKGFDVLLEAFAELRNTLDCRLIILGEGKERERLDVLARKLEIANSVSMPGRVANAFSWMATADVFVLSSRREGLPAVLIEALAAGCAIVATDCPSGPREILEDGRWGQLVPVGSAPALTGALKTALTGPRPDAQAMRQRAQHFSLERALGFYVNLWSHG